MDVNWMDFICSLWSPAAVFKHWFKTFQVFGGQFFFPAEGKLIAPEMISGNDSDTQACRAQHCTLRPVSLPRPWCYDIEA